MRNGFLHNFNNYLTICWFDGRTIRVWAWQFFPRGWLNFWRNCFSWSEVECPCTPSRSCSRSEHRRDPDEPEDRPKTLIRRSPQRPWLSRRFCRWGRWWSWSRSWRRRTQPDVRRYFRSNRSDVLEDVQEVALGNSYSTYSKQLFPTSLLIYRLKQFRVRP